MKENYKFSKKNRILKQIYYIDYNQISHEY